MRTKDLVYANLLNSFTLLGILFVGLKLTNFIMWSWWLILIPIYVPMAISLFILLFVFVTSLAAKIVKNDEHF